MEADVEDWEAKYVASLNKYFTYLVTCLLTYLLKSDGYNLTSSFLFFTQNKYVCFFLRLYTQTQRTKQGLFED